MNAILGISAFYHDSAAALLVDGEIIAAAQEERFSRIKHDASFPAHAIEFCLKAGNVKATELSGIAYYEQPWLKFERIIETVLAMAPRGYAMFRKAIPEWLKHKLYLRSYIQKALALPKSFPVAFLKHHQSHAASAFFQSPFESSAIITMDGVGEWDTTTIGLGQSNHITLLKSIRFPHSLGLLYSAFTQYAGFKVNSGEYKLMGLAPYGIPKYQSIIEEHLVHFLDDGSFQLNLKYFDYCQRLRMTNSSFHQLFGRAPRQPESSIDEHTCDIAASIQAVIEKGVIKLAKHAGELTKQTNLVLAGGVALNCVANSRIAKTCIFNQIWVPHAPGDAGGAVGAAFSLWHQRQSSTKNQNRSSRFHASAFLGPHYTQQFIESYLNSQQISFTTFQDREALCNATAGYLAEGKIVGWFQDAMEFGPRALGNRSILADPRIANMRDRLNTVIKLRESFRPFAPAILAEQVQQYFEIPAGCDCGHMSFVASSRRPSDTSVLEFPAVIHRDGTARVQVVAAETYPLFHQLLQSFYERTGCPMLVNTSFNVRGEPIVCTPQDAYRCFQATQMDVLVMGSCIVTQKATGIEHVKGNKKSYLHSLTKD